MDDDPNDYDIIGGREGRTFPKHPFYCQPLGPGQLSLFNLLKAYSLLDPEVGYCQGLSFVTGILLLHVSSLLPSTYGTQNAHTFYSFGSHIHRPHRPISDGRLSLPLILLL